jgi:membrane protein
MAYYTMFSLAPVLIIVTGIVSQILSRLLTADFIARFLEQIGATDEILAGDELVPFFENVVGSEAAGWIQGLTESAVAPASLTVAALISLIAMFWGASNLFHHLKETLNIIWGVRAAPGKGPWMFVRGRLLAFAAVLILGILLITFLLLNTIVAAVVAVAAEVIPDSLEILNTWRFVQILQFVLGFVVMALIFALIFKVLPDVQITWKDVWVGALVTALLFIIGTIGMAIYFQLTSVGSLYGAAGSIIVVLIWFYYSSQIFLYGAEFTQVYATRYGSTIQPADHAVAYVVAITEEPVEEANSEAIDGVKSGSNTIFRAPAWFLELTGRIEGLFSSEKSSEPPENSSTRKQLK